VNRLDSILDHVKKTIEAMPQVTRDAHPRVNAGAPFVSADGSTGSRVELELMAGRSRVFEVSADALRLSPLVLGGPVPTAYNLQGLTVRTRYEPTGSHTSQAVEAHADTLAIIHALVASDWPTVAGLKALTAEPGQVRKVTARDGRGQNFESIISEVVITASFDTGA